jgi:hypothetical protein
LVRGQAAGCTGVRPRVQLWHGDKDTTINYKNLAESVKEWTNALGLPDTPSSTASPKIGFTGQSWTNSCDLTILAAYTEVNGTQPTAADGNLVVSFFALDKTGPDQGAAACP